MWPGWLVQLTRDVHHILGEFPAHALGQNGGDFLSTSFVDTALCYASIQIMRCQPRHDPEHFDGGASLLHGGLTVYGRRVVAYQRVDRKWDRMVQEPGELLCRQPDSAAAPRRALWQRRGGAALP